MVKINLKNFLNTWDEWHSFWVGFCESIHYRHPALPNDNCYPSYITGEYHYYMLGRTLGFLVLLAIIIGIVKLFI